MRPRTDDLLDRFRAGDRVAYEILWKRYHGRLRDFIRHHVAAALAPELAVDDLLQDTHVEALRCLDRFTYRRELAFFFWLCGIARRLIANRRRKLGRRARNAPIERWHGASSDMVISRITQAAPDASEQLRLREHLDLLAAGLDALPERRREAVLLRYIDGLDAEEAAAKMGMTPGAFRVLLVRALAELRRAVAELCGETTS